MLSGILYISQIIFSKGKYFRSTGGTNIIKGWVGMNLGWKWMMFKASLKSKDELSGVSVENVAPGR